jgi:hypothetical protein
MFKSPGKTTESEKTSCPDRVYDYNVRYNPHNGFTVYGYPSSGGVLIRESNALELLHLGIDRFQEAKRASSTSEEDVFCKRLGQVGATLWWDKASWIDAILGEGNTAMLAKEVHTGWPSSGEGVWVLEYLDNGRDREMERWRSLLNLCLAMDERCKIIEQAGGTFYSDPDDCAALIPLLES